MSVLGALSSSCHLEYFAHLTCMSDPLPRSYGPQAAVPFTKQAVTSAVIVSSLSKSKAEVARH